MPVLRPFIETSFILYTFRLEMRQICLWAFKTHRSSTYILWKQVQFNFISCLWQPIYSVGVIIQKHLTVDCHKWHNRPFENSSPYLWRSGLAGRGRCWTCGGEVCEVFCRRRLRCEAVWTVPGVWGSIWPSDGTCLNKTHKQTTKTCLPFRAFHTLN